MPDMHRNIKSNIDATSIMTILNMPDIIRPYAFAVNDAITRVSLEEDYRELNECNEIVFIELIKV